MKKHPAPADHDTLQESFVKFAQDALALAEQWPEAKDVPIRTTHHYVFEGGGVRETEVSSRDYDWMFRHHVDTDIVALPSAETCARRHLEAGIIKPPKMSTQSGEPIEAPTFDQMRWFLIAVTLIPVVRCVLRKHESFHPTHEQILDCYLRFRTLWERKTENRIFTVPLVNFDIDMDCVNVYETWVIAKFADDEKSALWNAWFSLFPSSLMPIDTHVLLGTSSCIRGAQAFSIANGYTSSSAVRERVYWILSALRLLKTGDVLAVSILNTPEDLIAIREIGADPRIRAQVLDTISLPRYHSANRYKFGQSDIDRFLGICRDLTNAEKHGALSALNLALSRFNMAYERDNLEDRIIDLTIALESSLLSDVKEELQYRLALRGAALLSDCKGPRETAEQLRTMYRVRSEIVHNGLSLKHLGKSAKILGKKRPAEFVEECMDVTRMVLREYAHRMACGETLRKICQDLDQRIVGGLAGEPSH